MEEFELSQIMDRIRGMGDGNRGNMRPEDIDMEARNRSLGKPVPGLPGVHFSPDIQTASRKAAESTRLWNSPDRISHPAIGFSQSRAGIGTADSAINSIMPRMNEKGIYRDSTGTWQIRGTGATQGGGDALGIAAKVKGSIAAGSQQTQVPQLGQNRSVPGVIPSRQGTALLRVRPPTSANGGNVSVGNVPANTNLNVNVSGGTQTSNGRTTTGTPGQATVNGKTGLGGVAGQIEKDLGGGGMVMGRSSSAGGINQNNVPGSSSATRTPVPGSTGLPPRLPIMQGGETLNPDWTGHPGTSSGESLPQGNVPAGNMTPGQANTGYSANTPAQPGGTLRDILMSVTKQSTQNPISGGYMSPDSQLGQMQAADQAGVAAPTGAVGDPMGIVASPLQQGNAQGMDWASVNQWDDEIAAAVARYPEVDPAMIKAAMAMESLGNPNAKNPASSSYGVLQIQPEWHRESAAAMGLTLSADGGTPADDIMYWTALMAGKAPGQQVAGDTPLDRYINNYGQPPSYRADVETLMNEVHAAEGAAGPLPQQTVPQPGVGDVGNLGLEIIPTPQRIPGSAATGQPPGQATPTGGGVLVGEDAAGQQPSGTFDPNVAFPGSGAKLGSETFPVDPSSGASLDPSTGQPVPGNATPAPSTTRPPKVTGTISGVATPTPDQMTGIAQGASVQQGDGLGIYAGPEADESWVTTMSPNGGVNGDYKQFVCDGGAYYGEDGCCSGGGCSYASTTDYFDPRSANQTVHPGYDIALENGTPFNSPIDAVVLGTSAQPGGEGCISPATGGSYGPSATINNCNWAYDSGLALGGISDSDGSPIVINLDHVTADESLVGQQITSGTQLGWGLDKGHVHVEAHGFCSESGTNVILDPSLVMGGFYNTHSACEGVTRPVQQTAADTSAGYMGTDAYNNLKSQYAQSQVDQGGATYTTDAAQGYDAPQSAPATYTTDAAQGYSQPAQTYETLPPPSYYDQGTSTGQTYQVTTDSAGRQYEIMADGSSRLIYDPSW